MKITKKYLKECIRYEKKIIRELRKETEKGTEHYKRDYPMSLSEGKIKAYRDLLENEK